MAAKNIMVEPFTLEEVKTVLCYDKYTMEEFIEKEKVLNSLMSFIIDVPNYLDFVTLLIKMVKLEYI